MIDWDDIRYFLAVARGGSVRAAAEGLGVYHSTVLRRIAQLEERLGAQMFEKLPSGYRLTAAGEEVLELANQMEASSHQLETRVFGRDQSVRGLLRVTLAPTLATHLLMPDLADFALLHPDIEMEIVSSGELVNLTNREADVAIRVVYDRKTLPLNLHGLKGPELFGGVYMSRDRLAAWHAGATDPIRWNSHQATIKRVASSKPSMIGHTTRSVSFPVLDRYRRRSFRPSRIARRSSFVSAMSGVILPGFAPTLGSAMYGRSLSGITAAILLITLSDLVDPASPWSRP
ncbi:LysR family transcriptional regulator [Rhizobium leguminosarum]|uniref:LysR family transcriptional regulator n=1 Tax=Rhizobium leguminosarum TaxID=384 RepID=UPI001DC6E283|nr:molybdenum-dependent DNA-binding transcriptional regulator ModE [Rhizobium leguminosarum]